MHADTTVQYNPFIYEPGWKPKDHSRVTPYYNRKYPRRQGTDRASAGEGAGEGEGEGRKREGDKERV